MKVKVMDYKEIGLKIGLEIHQQLDTHKLFCNCPSELSDEVTFLVHRRLRPVQSELGEVDLAALEESKRKLSFLYQGVPNSCLVELDEEPPHEPNNEAIEITLQIVGLLKANPVDELTFMRKIVLDGSNPSGFQRTGLIGYDGCFELESGAKIKIPSICIEEDAARKIESTGDEITYRLDRLGIPEIEITTEPVIQSPGDARETAKRIGQILRATGKVRHGIGTIRQDINISIEGGTRCEIKLVQELNAIPKVIEYEVFRQLRLLETKDELIKRGVTDENLVGEVLDLTDILKNTGSKILGKFVKMDGRIFGFKLKGFRGLFQDNLGPELADYAKTRGVRGLFHTDELPGFGIVLEEVEQVEQKLNIGPKDGFVLVGGQNFDSIKGAIDIIVHRAKLALLCVPAEVRGVNKDNTTFYQRPLPGAARMYPETDVPVVRINQDLFSKIVESLPELPEVNHARMVQEYNISKEQAKQLINTDKVEQFEIIAKQVQNSKLLAQTLLNTIPELKTARVPVDNMTDEILLELFFNFESGKFSKEAIPDILTHVLKEEVSVSKAITDLGIESTEIQDVESIIDSILIEPGRQEFIQKNRMDALGPLMGIVMGKLKGKADGGAVAKLLKEKLKKSLMNRDD
jgi:glutamyl-tRNA(Gln) amidotransferase subunit E